MHSRSRLANITVPQGDVQYARWGGGGGAGGARNVSELLEEVFQRRCLALLRVFLHVRSSGLRLAFGREHTSSVFKLQLLFIKRADQIVKLNHDLFTRIFDMRMKLIQKFLRNSIGHREANKLAIDSRHAHLRDGL